MRLLLNLFLKKEEDSEKVGQFITNGENSIKDQVEEVSKAMEKVC